MRQDKFEQVLIVLGTLFFSVFGMMAPSAWAQNPTPSIAALLPVSAHSTTQALWLEYAARALPRARLFHWQLARSLDPWRLRL
jgi:hypothetical protein